MTAMPSQDFTLYSVASGRSELRRSRLRRSLPWALIAAACAVILVFAYLILSEGVV